MDASLHLEKKRARIVSDPRPRLHIFPPNIPLGFAGLVIVFPPEFDGAYGRVAQDRICWKGFQFTEVRCRLSLDVR